MSLTASHSSIELRGVRVHNLKGIDLDVPLGKLVVITGVSGAGKSSLAFDTLYTEGQRRYIESFSTYSRQFLDRLERPDADRIDHIPPAVALRQQSTVRSRRATVATATEIHDYLRLLFAERGEIMCPDCRREVRRDSPASVQAALSSLPEGTRYQVCFPHELDDANDRSGTLHSLTEAGFTRWIETGREEELLVVIDRLVAGKSTPERLTDSLELAFDHGDGTCVILIPDNVGWAVPTIVHEGNGGHSPPYQTLNIDNQSWRIVPFNTRLVCGGCGREFAEPEPRLFSFHSPLGACPECRGLGEIRVAELPRGHHWEVCPACHGARLQPLARTVFVDGHDIATLCKFTVAEFLAFVERLIEETRRDLPQRTDGALIPQIVSRLQGLRDLGLDYLTLDRPLRTLSTGELQRVLLTATLSSGLVSTLYVLDEPTVGLHPRDTERLLKTIERLRDAGNSVVAVEHDVVIIRRSDWLIELGPGAGADGGNIVCQGTSRNLENCTASRTGDYLSDRKRCELDSRTAREPRSWITLAGVRHNNLQNITAAFPLGVLCVVTGVSGSGKSSLVEETLFPALRSEFDRLQKAEPYRPGESSRNSGPTRPGSQEKPRYERVTGIEHIDEVILVDRGPLAVTARGNAATYLKAFDEIRALFADTAEAKVRNYTPGYFSFNNAQGGRCPTCEGTGTLDIDMQFLPDVTMTCADCRSTRFRREILDVKYRGLNIAEVLALSVREAFPFFRGRSRLQRKLKFLKDVGLDYLTLGQPAATLSGGESQRLKLAAALARGSRSRTLFLFDEPTAGLHPADVARLLECFSSLLEAGHSLVAIEHNLDLIRAADHVIDLGPGAGNSGGKIVAQGTPDEISRNPHSITGRFLATST